MGDNADVQEGLLLDVFYQNIIEISRKDHS